MHFAYWMVFIAAILPYLTIGFSKSKKGYDNAAPRVWLATLDGWRARAEYAHRNHFESFPAFAAAVIIAELKNAPQSTIDRLAAVFVILRVLYTLVYLADQAALRSLIWAAALGCTIALFFV